MKYFRFFLKFFAFYLVVSKIMLTFAAENLILTVARATQKTF